MSLIGENDAAAFGIVLERHALRVTAHLSHDWPKLAGRRPAGATTDGSAGGSLTIRCGRAVASESLARQRDADPLSRRGPAHCRAGEAPELRGMRGGPRLRRPALLREARALL
jgi:hypothetical protein